MQSQETIGQNGVAVDPRREEARRLRAEGGSIGQIAAALNLPKSTVGYWLAGIAAPRLAKKPRQSRSSNLWLDAASAAESSESSKLALTRPVSVQASKWAKAPAAASPSASRAADASAIFAGVSAAWATERANLAAHPAVTDPERLPQRLLRLGDRLIGRIEGLLDGMTPHELVGALKIALELSQIVQGKPSAVGVTGTPQDFAAVDNDAARAAQAAADQRRACVERVAAKAQRLGLTVLDGQGGGSDSSGESSDDGQNSSGDSNDGSDGESSAPKQAHGQ